MIASVQHSQAFDAAPCALQEGAVSSIHPEERQSFKWNKEREAIFASACIALIYLNGGQVELKKERVAHPRLKSAISAKAIKHILQRVNFPQFKTLPKRVIQTHIGHLRTRSEMRGSTLEEELLKQYQELEAKIIVNGEGKEIPAIYQDLDKFGIQPEEYDQWLPIASCFTWDKEKEGIFTGACIALIYLNGGQLELKKERAPYGNQKSIFSPQAIESMLQSGNFPQFNPLPKTAIRHHLDHLREKSEKRGSILEEELLNRYQELEKATLFNDAGEEILAIWKEVEKFGIKPDDYDSWIVIQSKISSKRRKSRKRPAEESADPGAEPQEKRANNAFEKPSQGNRVLHWKKRLISAWEKHNQHNYF